MGLGINSIFFLEIQIQFIISENPKFKLIDIKFSKFKFNPTLVITPQILYVRYFIIIL